jgi:hypothetical protein
MRNAGDAAGLPHFPVRWEDEPSGSVAACGSRGRVPGRAHEG